MQEDARDMIKRFPIEKKLHFIGQIYATLVTRAVFTFQVGPQQSIHDTDVQAPRYYLSFLLQSAQDLTKTSKVGLVSLMARSMNRNYTANQTSLREVLAQLKVDCQCQSVNWVMQFIELGGLKALFGLLDAVHKRPEK